MLDLPGITDFSHASFTKPCVRSEENGIGVCEARHETRLGHGRVPGLGDTPESKESRITRDEAPADVELQAGHFQNPADSEPEAESDPHGQFSDSNGSSGSEEDYDAASAFYLAAD